MFSQTFAIFTALFLLFVVTTNHATLAKYSAKDQDDAEITLSGEPPATISNAIGSDSKMTHLSYQSQRHPFEAKAVKRCFISYKKRNRKRKRPNRKSGKKRPRPNRKPGKKRPRRTRKPGQKRPRRTRKRG